MTGPIWIKVYAFLLRIASPHLHTISNIFFQHRLLAKRNRMSYPTPELQSLVEEIGSLLNQTGQTLAIAESTTGGLLSAALLSVNGAAGWYKVSER